MIDTEIRLWSVGGRVQEIIGLDNTAKLMRAYVKKRPDGRRYCRFFVHVPRRIEPNGRLSSLIGYDYALRLANEFGGDYLELPRSRHIMLEHRNQLIAKMSQFYQPDEIAEMLTMTPRTIRNIQKSYLGESENHEKAV